MSVGFDIADRVPIGRQAPLVLLAGPCVIETAETCLLIARRMQEICADLGFSYVFKASFDKANRTSLASYRGPGLKDGLDVLRTVKSEVGVPVLTDIHECWQAEPAAEVADVLQIPAFLCRQTDLLLAAAQTGRCVNVKKAQFMAPQDMAPALEKMRSTGNARLMLTERGSALGYRNLVVDMRSLVIMGQLGVPVVFDCTHAVQLPGGQGAASGGLREFVLPLARAATATGIQGLFMEVHPDPDAALCDGANSVALADVADMLTQIKAIHDCG